MTVSRFLKVPGVNIPRRVPLHGLYREIEALGGASSTASGDAYNEGINDVLAILRHSGFGDGFYVDQSEYDGLARASVRFQQAAE